MIPPQKTQSSQLLVCDHPLSIVSFLILFTFVLSLPFLCFIGALDNASGTAAVLEMARLFSEISFPFTLVFILFTGIVLILYLLSFLLLSYLGPTYHRRGARIFWKQKIYSTVVY